MVYDMSYFVKSDLNDLWICHLTCNSDLGAECLLTHDVLNDDGVDARIRALSRRDEELGQPISVAHGYTFGHGHSVFQPDYSWHGGCLPVRVIIVVLNSVDKAVG